MLVGYAGEHDLEDGNLLLLRVGCLSLAASFLHDFEGTSICEFRCLILVITQNSFHFQAPN